MAKPEMKRIDVSLIDVFGRVGSTFAEKIKKEYNLEELFISDVMASKLVAGKMNGLKFFDFKVKKTGSNSGILEFY